MAYSTDVRTAFMQGKDLPMDDKVLETVTMKTTFVLYLEQAPPL